MTITPRMQQVLDDLAADTTAEWQLVEGHKIRCGVGDGPDAWHCPLSYLAQTKPCRTLTAGRKLGLSYRECIAIVNAADNDTMDDAFRLHLLRACRLDPAGEGQ